MSLDAWQGNAAATEAGVCSVISERLGPVTAFSAARRWDGRHSYTWMPPMSTVCTVTIALPQRCGWLHVMKTPRVVRLRRVRNGRTAGLLPTVVFGGGRAIGRSGVACPREGPST